MDGKGEEETFRAMRVRNAVVYQGHLLKLIGTNQEIQTETANGLTYRVDEPNTRKIHVVVSKLV